MKPHGVNPKSSRCSRRVPREDSSNLAQPLNHENVHGAVKAPGERVGKLLPTEGAVQARGGLQVMVRFKVKAFIACCSCEVFGFGDKTAPESVSLCLGCDVELLQLGNWGAVACRAGCVGKFRDTASASHAPGVVTATKYPRRVLAS